MSVNKTWHIENRVLYYRVEGEIGLEDIQRINDEYTEIASQNPHLVHSIMDLRNLENLKLSMKDMIQLRNVKTFGGWTVVLRSQGSAFSKAVVFFIKMAEQVFGMRLATVDSLEAADEFLRQKDPTLSETIHSS